MWTYLTHSVEHDIVQPFAIMILNQIAWVDCVAFFLLLAPQLLVHVGIFELASCASKALPHLSTSLHMPCGTLQYHTDIMRSTRTSLPTHQGTILHRPSPAITLRSARHSLSRRRHPMCSICLRQHPGQDRQSLLLQGCGASVLEVPHAEARHLEEPHLLARGSARTCGSLPS